MQLTEADRQLAASLAAAHPLTAHGITRTGPCKVSGAHISEAPNAVFDLGSPQATADRAERIAARMVIRAERARDIREAKALIRKHLVRSPAELLSLMQCIHGAIERPVMDDCLKGAAEQLLDVCADLDSELNGIASEVQS